MCCWDRNVSREEEEEERERERERLTQRKEGHSIMEDAKKREKKGKLVMSSIPKTNETKIRGEGRKKERKIDLKKEGKKGRKKRNEG